MLQAIVFGSENSESAHTWKQCSFENSEKPIRGEYISCRCGKKIDGNVHSEYLKNEEMFTQFKNTLVCD